MAGPGYCSQVVLGYQKVSFDFLLPTETITTWYQIGSVYRPRISLWKSTNSLSLLIINVCGIGDKSWLTQQMRQREKGDHVIPYFPRGPGTSAAERTNLLPHVKPDSLFVAHFIQARQALASIGGFSMGDSGVINSSLGFSSLGCIVDFLMPRASETRKL